MRNKTLFIILVSLFAVFFMVGTSMAANSVTMKSDKPIIPQSECGHAGNISQLFDADTIMHEGDTIRFLLSNGTSVCGTINYFLAIADEGDEVIANAVDDPIQSTTAGGEFTIYSNGSQVGGGDAIISHSAGTIATEGSQVEVGFLVQATDGSRYITLTLAVRDLDGGGDVDQIGQVFSQQASDLTVTYSPTDPADFLTVKLFDGNDKATFFYEKDADGLYLDDITADEDYADNVLCIDTIDYTGSQVYAVPESRPANNDNTYQLSYLGDYIIAQIVDGVVYTIEPACKDAICRKVDITPGANQAGDVVAKDITFDFGNYTNGLTPGTGIDRWKSSGYCTGDTTLGNGIIFYSEDNFHEGDKYEVKLTVRAGSTADPDAVWWPSTAPDKVFYTSSNSDSNCDVEADDLTSDAVGVWQYKVDNDRDSGFDESVQIGTFTIGAADTDFTALMFDIQDIKFNTDEVVAGQKIYVDVEVVKLPCGGSIKSESICVAELVSPCSVVDPNTYYIDGIAFIGDPMLTDVLHGYLARTNTTVDGQATKLFFPYAPALNDDTFFTGVAITNRGTGTVKLTIKITDSNGGSATYTPTTALTVVAGGQAVFTLNSLIDDLVDGATALNPDLGCSVTITCMKAQ